MTYSDEVYTYLTKLTDLTIEHFNPCKKEKDKCLCPIPYYCCVRTNFKRADLKDKRCLYLTDIGGCLKPNLGCKIFLCRTVLEKTDKDCIEILKAIETIAKKFGFTEHPYLGERYAGIDNG